MVDLNVRSGNQQDIYTNQGNISVKVNNRHLARLEAQDEVQQATNKTYIEDRVPPANAPQLSSSLANASTTPQNAKMNSPDKAFAQNLTKNMHDLTDKQFNALVKGNPTILSKEQAQNKLIFAWNHPKAAVEPEIRELIEEMANQAQKETQGELSLGEAWEPSQPNTDQADQEIADSYSENFEMIAQELALDDSTAKTLEFAHYHPEQADLTPDLQALLEATEAAAEMETQNQEGFPDGWKTPVDTKKFDKTISLKYDDHFSKNLDEMALKKGLSKQEKAQLETLHYNPKADVPDRAKLLNLLKELTSQSKQNTREEFNLPANFKFLPSSKQHEKMLNQQFDKGFKEQIDKVQPPLSPDQKASLLANSSLSSPTLSPDLKKILDKLKGETISEMKERYGLPQEWQPKAKLGTLPTKNSSIKENAKADKGAKSEETEDTAGISSDKRIPGSRFYSGKVNLGETQEVTPRDNQLAENVLNHFTEYQKNLTKWGNTYLNSQERMPMGDCMLAVSSALDRLRDNVYKSQIADTEMLDKTSKMQKENTNLQLLKQKEMMDKQKQDKPKECVIFKAIEIIIPIPSLSSLVIDRVKLDLWMVDILTGGMVTMITQAANIQPISENPLEMLGWISKDQAQWVDLACQIVVMVAEMVISALLAQPELVAAEVVEMTAAVSEVAVEVALKAAEEAIKEAAEQAVQQALKQGLKEGVGEGLKEGAEQGTKAITREAAEKIFKETFQKTMKEEVEKIIQQQLKEAAKEGKKIDELAIRKGIDKGVKETIDKTAQKGVQRMIEENGLEVAKETGIKGTFKSGVREVQGAAQKVMELQDKALNKLKEVLRLGKDDGDEVTKEMLKAAKKAAAKNTAKGEWMTKMGKGLDKAVMIQDVLTSALQGVGQILQGVKSLKQADLTMTLAKLQADLDMLGTDMQILRKVASTLLDNVTQEASWINDINKQESQYWKNSNIRFISA